jgi:hypothetical protein
MKSKEMLQSSYKYSDVIDTKGENYAATESLIMSLLLEQ